MSQKLFWNWQQVLTSYDLGQSFMGILFPGRYCGFDTKSFSGMTLSLTHAGSGIIQTDINGTVTTATGVWVNKQGMCVQEDATLSIGAIAANSSGDPRIDLILGNYLKPPAAVGSATYQIVTGTPGPNPVAPAVPLPARQVILGYLFVPNGTTVDLTNCIFTPANVPQLGNSNRTYEDVTVSFASINWVGKNGNTATTVIRKDLKNNSITFTQDLYSIDTTQTIMTLPVGYRPTKDLYISVLTDTVLVGSVVIAAALKITTAGVVTLIDTMAPPPQDNNDCLVHVKGLVLNLD